MEEAKEEEERIGNEFDEEGLGLRLNRVVSDVSFKSLTNCIQHDTAK
jgi:hypothetical protein